MRDYGTHRPPSLTDTLNVRIVEVRRQQHVRASLIPKSLVGTEQLTRRQREVVALVIDGASNGEIAAALGTSAKTVRNHLTAITRKTGARNRTHLAAVAARAQARQSLAL